MSAIELLQRLRHGGRIVSTAALSPEEIAVARTDGRMFVDEDNFGYVWEHGDPAPGDIVRGPWGSPTGPL